jgi:hypothetical protein
MMMMTDASARQNGVSALAFKKIIDYAQSI